MLVRKDLFNQLLELAGVSVEYLNAKDDNIKWITVKGNHIPIRKGQTEDEAVKAFLSNVEGKGSKKVVKEYKKASYDDIQHHEKYIKDLSNKDWNNLKDFTGWEVYQKVNKELRTGEMKDKDLIESLTNTLDNQLNGNFTLYRYMNQIPEGLISNENSKDIFMDIQSGKINEAINKLSVLKDNSFVDKGFVSTCRDEFEDDGFGDIRLDIKTNKNTKGLALESISDFPEEQEILLQRNTKFKITDIKTSNKKNAKIIIECEVINE